jgi:pyruvate kinase
VEFSFVQGHEDVAELQEALARERPEDWRRVGLVLKIETSRAVRDLPDMLIRAAGRQPTAIMIARGDLAVEIGFVRLAEMQEEILWLCEAAHVPVIWATQVIESYLKTGVPTRGELTDAAMAARAECVMLNKGPYLFQGIEHLDRLLGRMSGHMTKKTPQLRPLRSW